MRLYGISQEDVESAIANPAGGDRDGRGNARIRAETADGRPILVVVAQDDPEFVVTVFLRS